jgi:hypothetical protein
MRKPGSKERIRQFLLANVGKMVTSNQIRDAIGTEVTEWARRVRELREDEKWPILTHNDRADLKPGQYILTDIPPEKKGSYFPVRSRQNFAPRSSTEMDLPVRCAALRPATLIHRRGEKFDFTLAT